MATLGGGGVGVLGGGVGVLGGLQSKIPMCIEMTSVYLCTYVSCMYVGRYIQGSTSGGIHQCVLFTRTCIGTTTIQQQSRRTLKNLTEVWAI